MIAPYDTFIVSEPDLLLRDAMDDNGLVVRASVFLPSKYRTSELLVRNTLSTLDKIDTRRAEKTRA